MASFPDCTFAVTARDDGRVFIELLDSGGAQIVNWTMPADNAEFFATVINEKSSLAREMANRQ